MKHRELHCEKCKHKFDPFENCHFCDQCGTEIPTATQVRLLLQFEDEYDELKVASVKKALPLKKGKMQKQIEETDFFYSPAIFLKLTAQQFPDILSKFNIQEFCNDLHDFTLTRSIIKELLQFLVDQERHTLMAITAHEFQPSKFCSYCGHKLPTFSELSKSNQKNLLKRVKVFLTSAKFTEQLITEVMAKIQKI